MRERRAPRYQGRVSVWKDEEGYGFIAPNGGGREVFVHITAFPAGDRRGLAGEIVTYELGVNAKGQPRAVNVVPVRAGAARRRDARDGSGAILLGLGFPVVLGIGAALGLLPVVVCLTYLGLSAVAFIAYAADKSAARNGSWRIGEAQLHLFALGGGWPGALVAQQVLRHKSRKQSFRATFRITVVVNCAALAWLLSPSGAAARAFLGAML